VNEKNLGSTKNFEKAIEMCTGEIIFLSDQDDVWDDDKILEMVAVLDKDSSIGMVFSNASIIYETLGPVELDLWSFTFPEKRRAAATGGKFFEVLVSQNVVTGATMAFRSGYRENFLPIPDDIPNLIHDYWISLVIASEAEVVFLGRTLIQYRQHSSQQLGLGITHYELEAGSDRIRKRSHGRTIDFTKKEIERLRILSERWVADEKFAKKRGLIDFADLIREKQEKIIHLEVRENLPSAMVSRFLPVLKELFSGRYQKFSKGLLSAGKDVFLQ
jgi:glycosyltransferase involved in cell wall biosynthesis